MSGRSMRVVRLFGPGDLRLVREPVPRPGRGELLVRVEGCGLCPTDVRRYRTGPSPGSGPVTLGHEWVGRVIELGPGTSGWERGDRVYGDTFAGFAEFAVIATAPSEESHGAFRVPEQLPLERAVFIEPVADCLHALIDGGRVRPGQRMAVFGAGQMGLQLVGVAKHLGLEVVAVDPLGLRRTLAIELGAAAAAAPRTAAKEIGRRWEAGADLAVVAVGDPRAVREALNVVRPGGTVVLFAGFGDKGRGAIDLNIIHYREIALVGTTWVGVAPNQRLELYDRALTLLETGAVPTERLVSAYCGLGELERFMERHARHQELKTIVIPEG